MKAFILGVCLICSTSLFAKTTEEQFLMHFTEEFQQVMSEYQDFKQLVATKAVEPKLLKVYACQAVSGHYQMASLLSQNPQHMGLIHASTYQLLEDMLKTYSNYVSVETCLNSKGFL